MSTGTFVRAHLTWGLAVLVSAGAWLTPAPPAAAADRTAGLGPVAMSFTDNAKPQQNYAGHPTLVLSRTRYKTYIAYDLSALSSTDTVVSASIVLTVGYSQATVSGIELRHTGAGWSPRTLTYANRPAPTSGVINDPTKSVARANTTVTVPITNASGFNARGRVSLQIGYTATGREVRLSRAAPPTLRLVLRSGGSSIPTPATDLPYQAAAVNSSAKKVLAHYFPPFPISLDNEPAAQDYYTRSYLDPDGEDGKHRSYGGLLRDRPPGRAPIDGDFELTDAESEVRQASAVGIDGFTMNILDWEGPLWDQTVRVGVAAQRVGNGFLTVPNIDLASNAGETAIPTIASKLAELYRQPSAYRLADGRYALSSFKAEGKPVEWWQSVIGQLDREHNIKVAFIGVFLDLSEENLEAFAPISYALSIWGLRTPTGVKDSPDRAGPVHDKGLKWMAPVAIQDVRHRSLNYAESGNTETLRASWARTLADEADLVQIVTWNDYGESTQVAESAAHGRAFTDALGYYVAQYKSGRDPVLTGDELVLTHRIQKNGTKPTEQTTTMDTSLSGDFPPRDTIEVLALLKAPATVTLKVGSGTSTYTLPAGISARIVPLAAGEISANAVRAGQTVASVTSPKQLLTSIGYYDLQYYAATSRGR